ncbi:hypothetical protein [uncultured Phascolarctobacterium sp.]|uniref:hypothetical protein n=1 Tax=uncultured Phascolarctobacterium sp. TaxID=512296 RepID=UPI0025DEAF7F|nr:hypothetical protein [uncultured Phascolarctobacterium sp.]
MAKNLVVKSMADVCVLDIALCNYIQHARNQLDWLQKNYNDVAQGNIEDYQEKIAAAKGMLKQLRSF